MWARVRCVTGLALAPISRGASRGSFPLCRHSSFLDLSLTKELSCFVYSGLVQVLARVGPRPCGGRPPPCARRDPHSLSVSGFALRALSRPSRGLRNPCVFSTAARAADGAYLPRRDKGRHVATLLPVLRLYLPCRFMAARPRGVLGALR